MLSRTLKTLIVEDVKQCSDLLVSLLNEYAANIEVVNVITDFHEAYEYLTENDVDLVFLDVELGAVNSLSQLKKLPELDAKVIVTTAYDKYAIDAFKINAINFLLKPIAPSSLKEALLRIEKSDDNAFRKLKTMQVSVPEPKRIQVSTDDGIFFINPDDITCIEADGSYSVIRTSSGKNIMVSNLLKQYEFLLENSSFYRVSRSAIINLKHLIRYKKNRGGVVELADGSNLVIPRRNREEFNKHLTQIFGLFDY